MNGTFLKMVVGIERWDEVKVIRKRNESYLEAACRFYEIDLISLKQKLATSKDEKSDLKKLMKLFTNLQTKMKEVEIFANECMLKINLASIFYKRSSTAVKKRNLGRNNKVFAFNVINTTMYSDRCCTQKRRNRI